MSNPWTRIAEFAANPDKRGGFTVERHDPYGVTIASCSREGMDQMILHADMLTRFADVLELVRQTFPVCPGHGVNLILEDALEWSCDPYLDGMGHAERGWPVLVLNGWHTYVDEFCVALVTTGTPDGSLIVEMNP